MTSSIQPEVHNLSQRRQRKIEPRPQKICTENSVKIGPAVPEMCSRIDRQTDRQTDKLTAILRSLYRGGVNIRGPLQRFSYSKFLTINFQNLNSYPDFRSAALVPECMYYVCVMQPTGCQSLINLCYVMSVASADLSTNSAW